MFLKDCVCFDKSTMPTMPVTAAASSPLQQRLTELSTEIASITSQDEFVKNQLLIERIIEHLTWIDHESNSINAAQMTQIIDFCPKLISLCNWLLYKKIADHVLKILTNYEDLQCVDVVKTLVSTEIEKGVIYSFTQPWLIDVAKNLFARGCSFTPYEKAWLRILSGYVIHDHRPSKEFEEEVARLPEDKKTLLYRAAIINRYPFMHLSPHRPVSPQDYSINLMWINRTAIDPKKQNWLIPNEYEPEKKFKRIIHWSILNPATNVNIWYDSALVPKEIISQTVNLMRTQVLALKKEERENLSIYLRDIREIPLVNGDISIPGTDGIKSRTFFEPAVPVYFRVDILKGIIGDYLIEKKEAPFYVFADLDMLAIDKDSLFDRTTCQCLEEGRIILCKTPSASTRYENQFMILNGNNKAFMKAHKIHFIDYCFKESITNKSETLCYDLGYANLEDNFKLDVAEPVPVYFAKPVPVEKSTHFELNGGDRKRKDSELHYSFLPYSTDFTNEDSP